MTFFSLLIKYEVLIDITSIGSSKVSVGKMLGRAEGSRAGWYILDFNL